MIRVRGLALPVALVLAVLEACAYVSRTPEAQRILPALRARLDSLLKPPPS